MGEDHVWREMNRMVLTMEFEMPTSKWLGVGPGRLCFSGFLSHIMGKRLRGLPVLIKF
jgi:hypothetical protein